MKSPFPSMTVDMYLEILSEASTENHPFLAHPNAEAIGAAFVPFAQALVALVNVYRKEEGGYEEVRDLLEAIVHTFPTTDGPADPLADLLAMLNAAE